MQGTGPAKQAARDTGATGLLLESAKDNEVGNQPYPRSGFVLDERHNYYFWNAGQTSLSGTQSAVYAHQGMVMQEQPLAIFL